MGARRKGVKGDGSAHHDGKGSTALGDNLVTGVAVRRAETSDVCGGAMAYRWLGSCSGHVSPSKGCKGGGGEGGSL